MRITTMMAGLALVTSSMAGAAPRQPLTPLTATATQDEDHDKNREVFFIVGSVAVLALITTLIIHNHGHERHDHPNSP